MPVICHFQGCTALLRIVKRRYIKYNAFAFFACATSAKIHDRKCIWDIYAGMIDQQVYRGCSITQLNNLTQIPYHYTQ